MYTSASSTDPRRDTHHSCGPVARNALLPGILAVAVVACGTGGSGTGAAAPLVRDSAGVRIVENAGPDVPLGLEAVAVRDLIPPDSALTPVPWGVAADPVRGRVYVADWTGTRVAVFDDTGAHVGDLGRGGDGPGEFRSPTAIHLDGDGVLTVWDARRAVLSRWSPEGGHLGEDRAPLDYWGPGFAMVGDAVVAVTTEQAGGAMTQRLEAVSAAGRRTLHEVRIDMSVMQMPGGGSMPAQRVFAPSVVWTGAAGRIHALNGPDYRIDVLSLTGPVSSIRRAVEPIPATRAMAVEALESAPGPYGAFMRRAGITAEQIVASVGHEPVISPVQTLTVDPAGRLWVARTRNGILPSAVDVFDSDGAYRGTLELDVIPVAFLSDALLLGLRVEETGRTTLTLYELRSASDSRTASSSPSGAGGPPGPGEFRDCDGCPIMVELPPGRFLMGAPPGEAPAAADATRPEWTELAEKPQVEVEIAYRFALGRYEVTFAEWDRCVEAGGCTYVPGDSGWGRGDRPVIYVARRDAEMYIAWLAESTGRPYRLPSEAEWEYAARAGTATARWWGDELGRGRTVCDGCGSSRDRRSTMPVGSFPPNPFGLHDMLGNVKEWVADCWHANHEGAALDGSPRIETSPWWKDGECERPVYRGGTWASYPWSVRAAYRNYYRPGPWKDRDSRTQGFRVALTL